MPSRVNISLPFSVMIRETEREHGAFRSAGCLCLLPRQTPYEGCFLGSPSISGERLLPVPRNRRAYSINCWRPSNRSSRLTLSLGPSNSYILVKSHAAGLGSY